MGPKSRTQGDKAVKPNLYVAKKRSTRIGRWTRGRDKEPQQKEVEEWGPWGNVKALSIQKR